MENVLEVTVVKNDTQEVIAHVFAEGDEAKAICNNDYKIIFTTKNPSSAKDEF